MTGLLDYIFQDVDKKELDRNQLLDFIDYLDELIAHDLPIKKEGEYQAIKLRLIKRLNELNREQIISNGKDKRG